MLQSTNNQLFVGTSFESGNVNMSGEGRTNTHKRKSSKQQSNYKQRKSSMSGRNRNSILSDNESTGESENCDNNKIVLDTKNSKGLTHKQDKKLPHFLRKLWTMLHEPKVKNWIQFFFFHKNYT